MSAGIESLPDEVLEGVLCLLSGAEAWRCRRVSRRWRRVVEALREAHWRRRARLEHGARRCEEARRTAAARLTWRLLYRSLWLWRRVARARVQVRRAPPQAARNTRFQLLRGGVLACAQGDATQPGQEATQPGLYTTVAYYDLDTLEETHRERLPFPFERHAEGERLLVVAARAEDDATRLCVTDKRTRRRCYAGAGAEAGAEAEAGAQGETVAGWVLAEDALYYQTGGAALRRIAPHEASGELRDEAVVSLSPELVVEDVARVGPEQVNVLTTAAGGAGPPSRSLAIYSVVRGRARLACRLRAPRDRLRLLAAHGFPWRSAEVVAHLRAARFRQFDVRAAHALGDTLLLGTRGAPLALHVLRCRATPRGPAPRAGCPLLSVPLGGLVPPLARRGGAAGGARCPPALRQLEAQETARGHRVVLLLHASELLLVELTHDVPEDA